MKETGKGSTKDLSNNDSLFTNRAVRYLSRAVTLYVLSIIFKSFDLTFIHSTGWFSFRSQLFSLIYVAYGLIAWSVAIWVAKLTESRTQQWSSANQLVIRCAVLLLFGILVALGFGFVYGASDILFFNRYEAWNSFLSLSYELHLGAYMFYLMMLAFNGVIFYYKGWKESQIKAERLMRENIQAKYDALKNQIDPHFFFNSLSVLTNLVNKDADLAADYITQLAKTHRYILDKKFDNLVPLEAELKFLQSYLFLISIRRQGSIRFKTTIDEATRKNSMIPPATLQMLIENAIKHNRFSANEPLEISIRNENGFLLVENNIRKKINPDVSSGIGLENVQKRYELVCGQPVTIHKTASSFLVKLPVIISS